MIYDEIYNFCKVRDTDRRSYSNRAKYLIDLLSRLGIEYKIVRSKSERHRKYFYNIYAFDNSNKYLSAHYDIIDIRSDNANDDSASIINMIAYKLSNPSINLLILDGEEPPFGGAGSNFASKYLKFYNKSVKWILNLELTGSGKSFFIDNANTGLGTCIQQNFPECIRISTPFNDAMIFRNYGFNSCVLTTIDVDESGKPNMEPLYHSHSPMDSVDKISIEDMKNFTENILDKIVKSC